MLTAVPDQLPAKPGPADPGAGPSGRPAPWSYRIAGATSRWPAVELYQAGSLLDVVSSARLAAEVLRGARICRAGAGDRLLTWGRIPLAGGPFTVEFSRGRFRKVREPAVVTEITSWCWLAVADGRYDSVTVHHGESGLGRSLRVRQS
jgi:hypothetical protein